MTTFLWTVVILMAAALVVEILAFVGMALVATRAVRRASEITEQLAEKVKPSVRLVNELKQTLQPLAGTISREGREIASLVEARSQAIQAAYEDTARRAERIRLRLTEGVQTVEGQPPRRGVYRQVVEPVQTASNVVRGLKLALWFLRRVA
jgi:biopolymer transport protein ExbB/TolQ